MHASSKIILSALLVATLIVSIFFTLSISLKIPIPRLRRSNLRIITENFMWGANTTFVISWDDARPTDIYLAPIDERYGIRHTIFSTSIRLYPNASFWRYAYFLDELFRGHDVQSHCGEHVHLSRYSGAEQERLIKWGRDGIKEVYGYTPIVFAYPYGDTGGSKFVKKYFALGRTIRYEGTSWPPNDWALAGVTIPIDGIEDENLDRIPEIMNDIYHGEGGVFKGYGHTNRLGKDFGVTNFTKYRQIIEQISGWENVWYTTWGELVSYTIQKNNLKIINIVENQDEISFDILWNIDTNIYNVPVTFSILDLRLEGYILLVDGKISNSIKIVGNKTMISVRPNKGESITHVSLTRKNIQDNEPPAVKNIRLYTWTVFQDWRSDPSTYCNDTYTFLMFDVVDNSSYIKDVNITIALKNGSIISYENIRNPIFWNNSTYGRILFGMNVSDISTITITAIDISNNAIEYTFVGSLGYYKVTPNWSYTKD
ncbi:MAG: polysaccharide deacetylase family protein [Candidatus Njordarchaeia archaeon]